MLILLQSINSKYYWIETKIKLLQVEIRNSNVGDDLHKTILTVNCDKKEKIVDEQVNQTKEVKDANNNESALFHLNIPILSEKVERVDLMGKDTKEKTESSEEADILVNLAKTAKEMREIIMQRKKKDPRREKRKDLKRRVEMVEELWFVNDLINSDDWYYCIFFWAINLKTFE